MTDKITYTREVTTELNPLTCPRFVRTKEGEQIDFGDLDITIVDKLVIRLANDIYTSLAVEKCTRFGIYRSDDTGQAKSKTELDLKDLKVLKTIIDDTAGSYPGIFDAHVKVNLMIKDLES